MYNIENMTLKEIQELYLNYFPKTNYDDVFNLPLKILIKRVEEEEQLIDKLDIENSTLKHIPSRKKKSRRSMTYKNNKFTKKYPKWKEKSKKSISKLEDTTNRSYLKKKCNGYIKLKPKNSIS